MNVTYDPAADALHIRFRDVPVEESREDERGFLFDYDRAGRVVGIEILDASEHIDNPCALAYETLGAASNREISPAGRLRPAIPGLSLADWSLTPSETDEG